MTYHINCNTDNKYLQHCMAMLCSLFETNSDKHFIVHILTGDLSEYNRQQLYTLANRYRNECKIYDVDETPLEGVLFRKNRPLTKAAYYRLLLPSYLSNVHRLLYLDCDMIVLRGISPLFELELEDYPLAACIDPMPLSDQHRRQLHMSANSINFCSGVMMINLDYWRKCNAQEKLIEYAKRPKKEVLLHDQDALNYVFKDKWFLLPSKWNVIPGYIPVVKGSNSWMRNYDLYDYLYEPCIYHYANGIVKAWDDIWSPQQKLYKEYVLKSGMSPIIYTPVSFKKRIIVYKVYIQMFYESYFYPIMPRFIQILLDDIKKILRLVLLIIRPWRAKKEFVRCLFR